MNGLPYYKAYPRDFIEGTIGMPFEIKCAYRVVLDLIYMQGGNLPDDARYISGLLGCTIKKWKTIRQHLIEAGKIEVSGEFLTNNRAIIELKTLSKLQEKQREKASRPRKNKDLHQPQQSQPEPDTDISPPIPPEGDVLGRFQEFWDAYPHRGGQKKNRKGAEAKYRSAIKRGVTHETIMAGVEAMRRFPDVQRGFARDPATWLNQEGWADEAPAQPALAVVNDRPKRGDLKTTRDGRVLEWDGWTWECRNDLTPADVRVAHAG
ncbi:DUF1376 domain-containing protein [uncultured Paracoccus sp.]|uniref:DUF1376 domain-containing protein n=1 Tax=uncultured Paracoccus sp. TaxID=189685 RepID=UPI002592444E|nr:DUF1376 domain-containing protein [uncultured Paracoccus sp.]